MPAAQYTLTIEQGATLAQEFIWKDSDDNPVDLTGYSAEAHVRESHDASSTLLELSTGDSTITLDEPNGSITLNATAATTAALSPALAVWDLEVTDAGGTVTRLVEGSVDITPEVTR